MMQSIKLSPRQLEIGITMGKTIEDFSNQLGISEQEFSEFLRRNFYEEKQKDYFRRLERNRKNKLRKGGKRSAKAEQTNPVNVEAESDNTDVESVAENIPEAQDGMQRKRTDHKEVISLEIETLREQLNSVELHHKELCTERCKIRSTLVSYQGKLQEMLETVKSFQQEVERLEGEINRTSDEMVETNLRIGDLREQLSKKESELEELQKKIILVLDSGELEDEDGNTVEVSGWEEIRDSFRKDEIYENLTGKQLKGLAKAIILKAVEPKVEYVFESDELEITYGISMERS